MAIFRNYTRHADSQYSHMHLQQDNIHADAEITVDGRLDITIVDEGKELDRLLYPLLDRDETSPTHLSTPCQEVIPLNIVIHVIGSRGDVQPFVAFGKELQKFCHRVRIATHLVFKLFVEDNHLDFFSIGGDLTELMAFMVKNPRMIPGRQAVLAGEIRKKRKALAEMFGGCWRSCVEAGSGTEEVQDETQPFVANAIMTNPPSFAHIHCAEKLRIPLHLMFT